MLKTCIGESFFEADTLDHEGVGDGSSSNFLDSDVTLLKILIEIQNGVDNHLGEELLVVGDNLRVQRSLGALFKEVSFLFLALVTDFNRNFLDSSDALVTGLTVTLDDDLGVRRHTYTLDDPPELLDGGLLNATTDSVFMG